MNPPGSVRSNDFSRFLPDAGTDFLPDAGTNGRLKPVLEGSSLLVVRDLTRNFGRLRAVNKVNLDFRQGELTAVIGPNGAGKTTLFNLISGRIPPTGGRIFFQGRDITGLPPSRIARQGLCRTFQITNILPDLTVWQNFQAAVLSRWGLSWRVFLPRQRREAVSAEAQRLLEIVGLTEKAHVPCSHLSHGDQRHVELGLALALGPRLLLLDEPTAGMDPAETEAMVQFIRHLAQQEKVTILLTEHDMEVVFVIAQRIVVMHQGEIIADGTPEEVGGDPGVRKAYLGE